MLIHQASCVVDAVQTLKEEGLDISVVGIEPVDVLDTDTDTDSELDADLQDDDSSDDGYPGHCY